MSHRKHHIHWKYFSANEFHHVELEEDEYFDTSEAATARVQELLGCDSYDFDLVVEWYDGDITGVPYRVFQVCSPDRG